MFVIPQLIHELKVNDNPGNLRRQHRQTGTLPIINRPSVRRPYVGRTSFGLKSSPIGRVVHTKPDAARQDYPAWIRASLNRSLHPSAAK